MLNVSSPFITSIRWAIGIANNIHQKNKANTVGIHGLFVIHKKDVNGIIKPAVFGSEKPAVFSRKSSSNHINNSKGCL